MLKFVNWLFGVFSENGGQVVSMLMCIGLLVVKVGRESMDSVRVLRSVSFFIWNFFEGDGIDWQEKQNFVQVVDGYV